MRELFEDQSPETLNLSTNADGPTILKSEIECSMRSMKKMNDVGEDGVKLEMILVLGEFGAIELTKLFKNIYASDNFIECMCESIFITLPKVEGILEYMKHRIISIMSKVTKFLLRVILKRVRSKIKPELSEEQLGFVFGKRARNAIFCLRTVAEKCIEV